MRIFKHLPFGIRFIKLYLSCCSVSSTTRHTLFKFYLTAGTQRWKKGKQVIKIIRNVCFDKRDYLQPFEQTSVDSPVGESSSLRMIKRKRVM